MWKILNYIILSSLLCIIGIQPVAAQSDEKKETAKKDSIGLWQGILVETDLVPLVQTAIVNKDIFRFQGNVQVNLKNKYFPTLEAGFAGAKKSSAEDVQFKTNGLFGKMGIDIPVFKPKNKSTQESNLFLAGIRLGMSHFNYSLNNLTITDGYWGGTEPINFDKIATTKFWFEINAGIRVEVFKNIFMGWNIKNRHLINKAKPGEIAPWYIPGYGVGKDSGWGFSYTLGYRFF